MACIKAEAAIETFVDSTSGLSASATFQDIGGGQLQVTLVNTFTGDTPDQHHVLTGIFFSGANGLIPVSASAPAGSLLWQGASSSPAPGSSVLGTEWAYASGPSAPGGATAGIVSAGYYSVGTGNFATPGDMLDGTPYGLVSMGYAGSALDGLGTRPYIQNSMVFVLSGFSGPLSNIGNVGFQYGTSITDPLDTYLPGLFVTAAPEPGTMAAGIFALLIFWPLVASQARSQGGQTMIDGDRGPVR
jgi:hypothetical protein